MNNTITVTATYADGSFMGDFHLRMYLKGLTPQQREKIENKADRALAQIQYFFELGKDLRLTPCKNGRQTGPSKFYTVKSYNRFVSDGNGVYLVQKDGTQVSLDGFEVVSMPHGDRTPAGR